MPTDLLPDIQRERRRRDKEALRMFRARPNQVAFFESTARERLSGGGNQCVSFDTRIPSSRGLVCASEVHIGDTVPGGTVVRRWISPEPVLTYKLQCEGGFSLCCNAEHPILAVSRPRIAAFALDSGQPRWVEAGKIKRGDMVSLALGKWVWGESEMTPNDGYFCGLMIGDGCLSKRYGGFSFVSADDALLYWMDSYLSDKVPTVSVYDKSGTKARQLEWSSQAMKEVMIHLWGASSSTSHNKHIPREVFKSKSVAREFIRGFTDTDGCVYTGGSPKNRQIVWVSASGQLLAELQQLLLAFGVYATLARKDKTLNGKSFEQWRLRARGPFADAYMLRIGVGLERKSQGYVPLLSESQLPKTKSVKVIRKSHSHKRYVIGHTVDPTNTYVTAGIQSHNSGKSTVCAVETASACLRMPVLGPDGTPLRNFKWSREIANRNRPLLIWCIGLGEDHLADTIYGKLFKPGSFQLIRDSETGQLRSWRGYECPEDGDRYAETEPAPPLINPDHVKTWGWGRRSINLLDKVVFHNGNELRFFTSKGDVKQGDQVDLIWIDEDIERPEHVQEWQARLARWSGYLIWSSWPRTANPALVKMKDRADEQATRPSAERNVEYFRYRFSENPYLPPESKRITLEGWAAEGEEVIRARDLGEFVTDTILMYPHYSEHVHGMMNPEHGPATKLESDLYYLGYQIPHTWTRYIAIDPGHSYFAATFWAVPPPREYGDHIVLYDELYMRMATARQVAEALAAKTRGQIIQRWVMDHRYGRQTASGTGKTFRQIYSEEFERFGVRSVVSGSTPEYASSDIQAGCLAVRQLMAMRPDGTCKLKVVVPSTPNWHSELRLYKKAVTRDDVKDEPASGQRDHLMDTTRYAAMANFRFVQYEPSQHPESPHYSVMAKLFGKKKSSGTGAVFMGAGTISQE